MTAFSEQTDTSRLTVEAIQAVTAIFVAADTRDSDRAPLAAR